jgi:hypothetical protein|tara:strand:+ start:8986 stop:9417 length:432 start_codon:yes stop_codon:yes gene_type:complete
MIKKNSYSKQGKINRQSGAKFELKVRENLEKDNWIIDKWTNNVDLENKKLVKAKRKFNPFMKILGIGTGFPDFIGFKLLNKNKYEIIGIEVKKNGYLDKSEREKCKWLLDNKIFSKILIAKSIKDGKRINIEFIDFKDKYKVQ